MRYIIILLLIAQIGYAQNYNRKDDLIRLGMFAGSILLNASGDACNNTGHKQLGHAFNAMSIGSLLAVPLVVPVDRKKWVLYIGTFSLLRYGIFDACYGLVASGDPFYQGGTGSIDKITGNIPIEFVQLSKLTCLMIGIQINFNKL